MKIQEIRDDGQLEPLDQYYMEEDESESREASLGREEAGVSHMDAGPAEWVGKFFRGSLERWHNDLTNVRLVCL